MPTPYDDRRQRERWDPDAEPGPGPGHETYDEQLERERDDWRQELDRDLEEHR